MTRILILMLGAMLTLAGCGGGSDGLEYGTPQVTVRGLESTVTVTVDGESYLFQRNETHKFGKVQKNKNYRVNVSGNKSCGFTGSHSANNDEVTQSASSKNANEHFIVRCDLSSDGTPGGGSGNDEDEDPSGHSISLELKGGVGANGNKPIEVNKPATVEVQLKDQNGNAVDGEPLVAYIQELPNAPKVGNLVNSTAITKDGGNASFQISAGKEAGVGRLVVVYYSESGDEIASKSITFETRGGETDSEEPTGPAEGELALSVEYGTGSEVTASSPATVKLTLTDESNAPVKGALVTFSLNSIDKVYGRLGTTSRLTNENGVAEVTLYAGRNAGAGSITARVEDGPPGSSAKVKGLRASAHFETKGDETDEDEPVGDAYSLEISSVANEVTADEAATITATLKDKDGGAVANELVVFNTQNGLGRLDPQIGTVQTDSEGKATITLYAGATKGADKIRVIFEQGGKTYSASTAFTTKGDEAEGEEPADEAYTVTIDPITAVIDKDSPATVVATLKDENGVLPNELITFKTASGLGRLDPSSGTARTDSNGEARITLRAGDIRGADKLEVVFSKNNREYKAEVVFETKGDEDLSGEPADDNYVVQVDPISSEIEAGAPVTVTATVKDSEGSPVKDELVVFTTTNGVGRLDPAIGTAKTDNDGIATIELHAGTVPGSGRIIATFDDNYKGDAVFTTKGDEQSGEGLLNTTVKITPPVSPTVMPGETITVKAEVTSDSNEVEVSGQIVQFVVDGDASFIPASGRVLTDSTGVAEIELKAGTEPGAGTITAIFTPVGTSLTAQDIATFEITAFKLTVKLEGDIGSVDEPITEEKSATVLATLTDKDGVGVGGKNINFETDLGIIEPGTMVTDNNGEARVSLRIGDEGGAGTVVATLSETALSDSANFLMTQTKDGLQLSELVLLDSSGLPGNGVVGKELSETNMAVARVRLVDDSGAPKPNEIIYFNIENTLGGSDHGVLDSPSALTDNQGYAEVNLRAGTKGAARLVATYNWKGVELRRSTPFMSLGGGEASDAIKPALGYRDAAGDFHDGKLQLVDQPSATGPVDAGSTVAIGVDLVKADDTSVAWPGVAKVELGSICTDNGTAQLDDTVTLINGRGVATYKAVGTACAQDQVWAKIVIEEKELNAFTEIFDIEHSPAGFIEFEGSEHEKISLKGASAAGLNETTTLTFLVKNQDGQTVDAGVKVNFSAVNALGGFKLNAQSALTNNEGIVEVQVASGTVPYTAIVRAELDEDSNVFAHGKIPVTTGVVTQDRFILSLSDYNPLVWDRHLEPVTVNVSAADRMGNLADGTVVYFTTKLGQIEDECVISGGECSVTWRSGGPQPIFFDENRQGTLCEADYLKAFEQGVIRPVDCGAAGVRWGDRYGRNVITAYTAGEESFRDDNGNNIFDLDGASTERYVSLTPEVFRDDNVTGKYENLADEFHIIPGLNPANTGKFHGVGCSEDAVTEGHCETLTHVRRSVEMTLSTEEFVGRVFGSEPNFNTIDWNYSAPIGSMMTGAGTPPSIEAAGIPYTASTIYVAMHDAHGASPGSGSSISIDEGDRELITTTCGTVKSTQTEVYICEAKFKAMKLVDVLDGNGDPTGDKALENEDPDPVRITLTNGIDTQEIVLGVDTTGL